MKVDKRVDRLRMQQTIDTEGIAQDSAPNWLMTVKENELLVCETGSCKRINAAWQYRGIKIQATGLMQRR